MTFEPPAQPGQAQPGQTPVDQAPPAQAPVAQSPQAAPQWAWVQPSAPVQWVETEPLEYHQLLRGVRKYRWWKPLVAVVLGVIYYLTLSVVFGVLVLVPYFLLSGAPMDEDAFMSLAVPDTQQPISLVLTLGSVALMIPSVWFAMWSTGLTPIGRGWSVALRIRWKLLFRTLVPALVALVVMNAVGIALELAFSAATGVEEPATESPLIDPQIAIWSAVIVLLLVPIQATAEELVFRGIFMQVLGAWLYSSVTGSAIRAVLRGPWIPILLPAVVFGFAHIYDVWGWLSVVALAIAAGWVTWRTGGLEAAITIHVVNNWVAFGFMTFAIGGETKQTESGAGLGSLIGSIVGLALYVWWVEKVFVRTGGIRTRIDLVRAKATANPQPPVNPQLPANPQPPTTPQHSGETRPPAQTFPSTTVPTAGPGHEPDPGHESGRGSEDRA